MVIAKYRSRHMSLTQGTDVEINEVDSVRWFDRIWVF
jgi:hypothetical protein